MQPIMIGRVCSRELTSHNMRKIKKQRIEQKNIRIGGIYILRNNFFGLRERPPENHFNHEWCPGLYEYQLSGTPIDPEQRAEATRIQLLQTERLLFERRHGSTLPANTVLLLVSRAVISACKKANRSRTILFQFLNGDQPIWFFFQEKYSLQQFMNVFKFVKASKPKVVASRSL